MIKLLRYIRTQNADDVFPKVLVRDDLDVILHDDVRHALTVSGKQLQLVIGEQRGILINVVLGHESHGQQLWSSKLWACHWKNAADSQLLFALH